MVEFRGRTALAMMPMHIVFATEKEADRLRSERSLG